MAIIVDKVQKKRDIALSCKELFLTNSINNLTIAQLASAAGVGKGTIYEYFKNKEEIVFEIVNFLMEKHTKKLAEELEKQTTTKDKIKKFSEFFYNEEESELRVIYKSFISLSLINPNATMLTFQTTCTDQYYTWFKQVIQDGIDSKELKEESITLALGIFAVGKGMFTINETTNSVGDLKNELDNFIDNIFKLMEVK